VTPSHELDKSVRTLTIIWGVYVLLVPIYLFAIPRLIGSDLRSFIPSDLHGTIRILLYLASFGLILLARRLSDSILAGRKSSSTFAAAFRHPAIHRYAAAMIAALGCFEAVALCGLVLFLMARDMTGLLLLGGVSILSMTLYRPRRDAIIETARGIETVATSSGSSTRS